MSVLNPYTLSVSTLWSSEFVQMVRVANKPVSLYIPIYSFLTGTPHWQPLLPTCAIICCAPPRKRFPGGASGTYLFPQKGKGCLNYPHQQILSLKWPSFKFLFIQLALSIALTSFFKICPEAFGQYLTQRQATCIPHLQSKYG